MDREYLNTCPPVCPTQRLALVVIMALFKPPTRFLRYTTLLPRVITTTDRPLTRFSEATRKLLRGSHSSLRKRPVPSMVVLTSVLILKPVHQCSAEICIKMSSALSPGCDTYKFLAAPLNSSLASRTLSLTLNFPISAASNVDSKIQQPVHYCCCPSAAPLDALPTHPSWQKPSLLINLPFILSARYYSIITSSGYSWLCPYQPRPTAPVTVLTIT